MSMVNELVKTLRDRSFRFAHDIYFTPTTKDLLSQAADTIEELSAKVARQNVINKYRCDITDYISRKDLIKYIYDMDNAVNLFRWRSADKIKNGLKDIIERQPAVDAEHVRYGKWIDVRGGYLFECSECKAQVNSKQFKSNLKYCPNCGAKMTGGNENG